MMETEWSSENLGGWNPADFRVVVSGQPATSRAALRIGKSRMSFSLLTAAEMDYPEYIQMLISDDATKMVIRPCDGMEPTAIPFYQDCYNKKKNLYQKPKVIVIYDRPLVKDIRTHLQWGAEVRYCSPLRFKEAPNTLFFSLVNAFTAEERKLNRTEGEVIACYPTLTSIIKIVKPVYLSLAR